jgi:hypothetical protein
MLKAPAVPPAGPRSPSPGSTRQPAAAGAAAASRAAGARARAADDELAEATLEAIERCRRGDWLLGLPALARIAEGDERHGALPGLVYSYLGYGIALRQQRIQDGLKLCQHAVKLEFYRAESLLNLARTQLLARQRRAAVRSVADGLRLEPDNAALLELQRELGVRKSTALSFLPRSHPVNLLLGRLRHLFRRRPPAASGD